MEGPSVLLFLSPADNDGVAEFELTTGDFSGATFTIDEPKLFKPSDYEDFIAHRTSEMTFSGTNVKYICLSWQNAKTIQFEVSVLGERSGSIILRIPSDAMLPALQRLADALK